MTHDVTAGIIAYYVVFVLGALLVACLVLGELWALQ
jgi:hypothetical protein